MAPVTAINSIGAILKAALVTTPSRIVSAIHVLVNFHPHLPHYELTAPEGPDLRVLGRQKVDPNRPHPFAQAGNSELNALIWIPPAGRRAGDIVLIDSTHFTTLFGGTDSLRNLWHNLVTMG